MNTETRITRAFIIQGRKRVGIRFAAGPWTGTVNPALIKIRPTRLSAFPHWVHEAFTVENNSDSREDYFEPDCIRMLPSHPLYDQVKAVAC